MARPGLRPEDHRRRRQRHRQARSRWFGKGLRKVAGRARPAVRARDPPRHRRRAPVPAPRGPGGERAGTSRSSPPSSPRPRSARSIALLIPARPARARQGGRLRVHRRHPRALRVPALALPGRARRLPVRREPAVDPRPRHGYIVGVDGISLFMVVDHRPAVPARACSPRTSTSSTASRRTSRGSSCSRWRSWGSSSRSTSSRSSCSGSSCSSRCTSSSSGGGPRTAEYAATKFFLYTAAGSALLLASTLVLGLPAPGRHRRAHLRLPCARRVERAVGHHRGAAVPRVHGRVRDQGAAVPVPHLAARRAHRGADCGLGGAGRRDHQDGCVRLRAVLVRAVPAGERRSRAAPARARGDRHPLRRDRRRDADRLETRHRVLVGRAHGLRDPGHLLAHDHRPRRRGRSRW